MSIFQPTTGFTESDNLTFGSAEQAFAPPEDTSFGPRAQVAEGDTGYAQCSLNGPRLITQISFNAFTHATILEILVSDDPDFGTSETIATVPEDAGDNPQNIVCTQTTSRNYLRVVFGGSGDTEGPRIGVIVLTDNTIPSELLDLDPVTIIGESLDGTSLTVKLAELPDGATSWRLHVKEEDRPRRDINGLAGGAEETIVAMNGVRRVWGGWLEARALDGDGHTVGVTQRLKAYLQTQVPPPPPEPIEAPSIPLAPIFIKAVNADPLLIVVVPSGQHQIGNGNRPTTQMRLAVNLLPGQGEDSFLGDGESAPRYVDKALGSPPHGYQYTVPCEEGKTYEMHFVATGPGGTTVGTEKLLVKAELPTE